MSSARETASLYGSGASDFPMLNPRVLDPGAPAWTTDPWLAIEHRIVFTEHRLPFWDRYDGYGTPFAAAMQPQPFYPLTVLLSAAISPRAYTAWVLLRLFFCGWFAALFVRLFAGRWAALAAGISAMLSGYYLLYYDMPHLSVDVCFPLLLWATELVCRNPRPHRIALLAAGCGLVYLGGMPETAFLSLTAALVYGIVRSFWEPQKLRALIGLVAGDLLGLGIGAIMILPFIQFEAGSFNIHDPAIAGLIPGLGMDLGWIHGLLLELAPRSLGDPLRSIVPPGGYTGVRGFFGCTVFMLAILGVASYRGASRRVQVVTVVLASIAVFAILKRFGSPLVNWTGLLPLARMVVFPKYIEFILGDAVAILAGLGVAYFEREGATWRPVAWSFGIALGVLTLLYQAIEPEIPAGDAAVAFNSAITIGIAAAVATFAIGIAALRLRDAKRNLLPIGFSIVIIAELCSAYIVPFLWVAPSVDVNPWAGAPYVAYLQSHLDPEQERVLGIGEDFFPNWPGAFGLADPRSLNALYPADYLPFVRAFLTQLAPDGVDRFVGTGQITFAGPLVSRWMALSSIRFVVAPQIGEPASLAPDLVTVYQSPGATIFRNPHVLPRLALFHRLLPVATFASALDALRDPGFDIDTTAVVEGNAPQLQAIAGTEAVRVVEARSDLISLRVHASSDALLMQNDTWYPGWVATVDGISSPILRVDGIFRGIAVSRGSHIVTIAYASAPTQIGVAISIAAVLVVALLLGAQIFRILVQRLRSGTLTTV